MSAFGLNVLAQYVRDEKALCSWIQAAQPAACIIMDGDALAQKVRQLVPNTTVIYRAYNPNDARWFDVITPQEWLTIHKPFARNGISLQVLNEPVITDAALLWLEALVGLCPASITLAFPNFAVGNPNEKDILAGKYDRLLKLVCGTRHILALHEYFKDDPIAEAPFLCGRFRYWLKRAAVLGLPAPKIVITEHGRDVGGGRGDGWSGAGWSEVSYFNRLMDAQEDTYDCNVEDSCTIPVCLYCWGTGANNDWLSFDIQDAATLQKLLIDWNTSHPIKEQPPMPDPYVPRPSTGTPGTLVKLPREFVNIREQPYADAADRGDLRKDEPLSYGFSPQAPGWAYITRTSDGVHGWVSLQNGAVEFAPDAAPLEPEPGMVTYTNAQVSAMQEHLNSARGHLSEVSSLLGQGVPGNSGGGF